MKKIPLLLMLSVASILSLTFVACDKNVNPGSSRIIDGPAVDVALHGALGFAWSGDAGMLENSAVPVQLSLSRVAGTLGEVSVDVDYSRGTAIEDVDFTGPDVIVFKDGETNKILEISSINDSIWESGSGMETIVIQLTNPEGGAGLGQYVIKTIHLNDSDDAPPNPDPDPDPDPSGAP